MMATTVTPAEDAESKAISASSPLPTRAMRWMPRAARAAKASSYWLRAPRKKCSEVRSEEHTSELQSLMRISYAVFCLKKKRIQKKVITYLKRNLEIRHNTKK